MGRGRGGRRGNDRNSLRAWMRKDSAESARVQRAINEDSNWSDPVGGCDSEGNPITASFGRGSAEGQTFLGDGDRSESNFLDHDNHNHYGSGDGPNNNVKDRGQYSGPDA